MKSIFWIALVGFIGLFSCGSKKNLNVEEYPDDLIANQEDASKNISITESYLTDTTGVFQIEVFKDSLLALLKNFDLIVDKQFDGECYGSDSLYFDNEKRLLIQMGYSGCLADVVRSTSIYSGKGEVRYYKAFRVFDGIVYRVDELYYKNGNPFYGTRMEFPLDTLDVVDDKKKLISSDEMELMADIKRQDDEESHEAIERIALMPFEMDPHGRVTITDTIKKTVEKRFFLVDSATFRKLSNGR